MSVPGDTKDARISHKLDESFQFKAPIISKVFMFLWILLLMSIDNMVLCNCLSAKNEHTYRKRHSFEKKKKKISSVYMDGLLAHIFHCLSELSLSFLSGHCYLQ